MAQNKSEQISEKRSILWNLTPLLIYLKISGTPTLREKENKSYIHRILGYFWLILSITCLLLNCFFQAFNTAEDMKRRFSCAGQSHFYSLQLVPVVFGDFFINCIIRPTYVAGIPLIFAIKFYFTGKFQEIFISIHKIERKLTLPSSFYRKCLIGCLFLIAISFMVREFFRFMII